jgi:hypothetical protein
MAFGIDDALSAATGGIKLTDTIVEIVKRYRKTDKDPDLELLVEEIRLTALRRIDEADLALAQFERTLIDAKVNIDKRLQDVIAETPFWRPFQQHRPSQALPSAASQASSERCRRHRHSARAERPRLPEHSQHADLVRVDFDTDAAVEQMRVDDEPLLTLGTHQLALDAHERSRDHLDLLARHELRIDDERGAAIYQRLYGIEILRGHCSRLVACENEAAGAGNVVDLFVLVRSGLHEDIAGKQRDFLYSLLVLPAADDLLLG